MAWRRTTYDRSIMIYRRRRSHSKTPGGYFNLESQDTKSRLSGFGHGEYISLRDEFGRAWRGFAERGDDNSIRYTFTDDTGNRISGVSDSSGVVLRDDAGKTWRGMVS